MAFVLMTQTYGLLKLKWGLQKLKWLIFDCCTNTNPGGGVLSGKVGTGMCGPDRVHF